MQRPARPLPPLAARELTCSACSSARSVDPILIAPSLTRRCRCVMGKVGITGREKRRISAFVPSLTLLRLWVPTAPHACALGQCRLRGRTGRVTSVHRGGRAKLTIEVMPVQANWRGPRFMVMASFAKQIDFGRRAVTLGTVLPRLRRWRCPNPNLSGGADRLRRRMARADLVGLYTPVGRLCAFRDNRTVVVCVGSRVDRRIDGWVLSIQSK